MRVQNTLFSVIRYGISMLFLYAGLTKLLEGDLLYYTIKDAALLPHESWASISAAIIPYLEIVFGICLLFTEKKLIFYMALCLFGTYLFFLIHLLFYKDTVPCTCRTVLPALGWYGHLYFTGGCIILTLSAIYLKRNIT